MKKFIFLFVLLLAFFSCAGWRPPSDMTYNWRFSLQEPAQSDTLTFSDEFINIKFIVLEKLIDFDIQNKTNEGIKINWDELSFISPDGTASRVNHSSGIRVIEKGNPQAPTVIPPNAKISDSLIPTKNIYRSGYEWTAQDLFPEDDKTIYNDKEFRIYLPIEIKGSKKEYTFKFKINVSQATTVPVKKFR